MTTTAKLDREKRKRRVTLKGKYFPGYVAVKIEH